MPFTVVYGILLIGIAVIILVLLYLFVEALLGAIKGEEGNA